MDEEKHESGGGRQALRPSMVVMTSKLLNVTEGVAKMNMRIACGVFVCLLLLVATFVVNIVAFDYARDNEVVDGSLVDKKTGSSVLVSTQKTVTSNNPTILLDDKFMNGVKELHLPGKGKSMIKATASGYIISPCPKDVPVAMQTEYCETDGNAYLVFAGDLVGYYKTVNGKIAAGVVETDDAAEFKRAAVQSVIEEHGRRHLLHVANEWQVVGQTCYCEGHCLNVAPNSCHDDGSCHSYFCRTENDWDWVPVDHVHTPAATPAPAPPCLTQGQSCSSGTCCASLTCNPYAGTRCT